MLPSLQYILDKLSIICLHTPTAVSATVRRKSLQNLLFCEIACVFRDLKTIKLSVLKVEGGKQTDKGKENCGWQLKVKK